MISAQLRTRLLKVSNSMKSKLQRLQEAYYRANKQYQHEIAIGSDRTLITARKRKRAFVAYNKAIREVA